MSSSTPGRAVGQGVVTVVVVTYNSARDVEPCLRSLLDGSTTADLEIVVVDNASTDNTARRAQAVAADDGRVTVVANEANVGFGVACNQGARLGTGDVVVLVNPDTVSAPGAIDALLRVTARPGVGPVGGRTVDAAGRLDPRSVQKGPNLWGELVWAVGAPVWGSRLPGAAGRLLGRSPTQIREARFDHEGPVPVVIGCLLAMRRPDWDALGGFDEGFFLYGEDVDLSLRAAARGLVPTYTPDACITHYVGRSSETIAAKLVPSMRGRATVLHRHWTPWRARLGETLMIAGVALRAAGERGRGPWAETFRRRAEWRGGYPAAGGATRNGSAA